MITSHEHSPKIQDGLRNEYVCCAKLILMSIEPRKKIGFLEWIICDDDM